MDKISGKQNKREGFERRVQRCCNVQNLLSNKPAYAVSSKPLVLSRAIELLIGPMVVFFSLQLVCAVQGVSFDINYLFLSVVASLSSFILFKEMDVWNSRDAGRFVIQLRNVLFAWVIVMLSLIVLAYVSSTTDIFAKGVIVAWCLITPFVLLAAHGFAQMLMAKFANRGQLKQKVVIVGINELGNRLAHEINADWRLKMSLCGYFDDRRLHDASDVEEADLIGQLKDLPDYVRKHDIDVVYVTLPMTQQQRILDLLDELRDTTASVYFSPDLQVYDLIQGRLDDINGIPVVAVCETPHVGVKSCLKRLSDVLISSIILLAISPILLSIAVAVRLNSPGNVIFKQRRYGLDGSVVTVYKFRSMTVTENGGDVVQAKKGDQRVTKVGAILRKYSLDELPQFINVLQGRMSVVGPRPHAVAHNEMYRKVIKGYMIRHKVKPGVTGWAQVKGSRGETDTVEKMQRRVELDLEYLRNWSLWFDIKIIVKTAFMMFNDENACSFSKMLI